MDDHNGQTPHIPDFMKKYHEALDYDGKYEIERAAQQYEAERQEFMNNQFVQQSNFQTEYNKVTGRDTKLDPDEATRPIREKYEQLANQKAVEYGYVEKQGEQATEQQAEPSLSRREQFLQQAAAIRERNGQRQVRTETQGNAQQQDKAAQKSQSEQPAARQEGQAAQAGQGEAQPQTRREIFLATAADIRTRKPTAGVRPK